MLNCSSLMNNMSRYRPTNAMSLVSCTLKTSCSVRMYVSYGCQQYSQQNPSGVSWWCDSVPRTLSTSLGMEPMIFQWIPIMWAVAGTGSIGIECAPISITSCSPSGVCLNIHFVLVGTCVQVLCAPWISVSVLVAPLVRCWKFLHEKLLLLLLNVSVIRWYLCWSQWLKNWEQLAWDSCFILIW